MTQAERDRITNEEYADLLIEYSGDYSLFNQFPDATYRIINFLYAVVHIPAKLITLDFISEWGYAILPRCFSVISSASIEASGIQKIRNIPNFNLRGQGVLMGFIDSGIDYTNPIFRNADGTTRIASLWDQTIQSEKFPENFGYGTEYSKEEINAALASEDPLKLVPSMDEVGHGTMVAGIAAGNESPENNFYGIATDSELVVIKLRQAKTSLRDFFLIPEDAVCYSEVDILFALNYLLDVANRLQRPVIICIALGTSQGGHDGRGVLSKTLSLIGVRAGTIIVIAAGNEGDQRRHYYGLANRTTGLDTLELMVGPNEHGFVLELWGEAPGFYSIDITSPSGEYIPRLSASLNESTELSFIFEKTVITLIYELVETQTGDQVIVLRFKDPAPGLWRFNVYERGEVHLGFHMWLPMDKFITKDTFFIRSNPDTTILAPGNAGVPITVTAYNDADNSLYLPSSRGYTRTGVIKPVIAAPGVNVIGPNLQKGFTEFSGTSVAVAHTAGVAAMLMEWGVVKNNLPTLNTIEMNKLMILGARRDKTIEYPNTQWGYGILDLFNIFNSIRLLI